MSKKAQIGELVSIDGMWAVKLTQENGSPVFIQHNSKEQAQEYLDGLNTITNKDVKIIASEDSKDVL